MSRSAQYVLQCQNCRGVEEIMIKVTTRGPFVVKAGDWAVAAAKHLQWEIAEGEDLVCDVWGWEVKRPSDLVPMAALTRYDENGDPLYTRPERVLLELRKHGWMFAVDLLDALDIPDDERDLYSGALSGLVMQKRVEMRRDHGWRMYRIAEVQPSRKSCACDSNGRCAKHAEIRKPKRVLKTPDMCDQCRLPATCGKRCEMHAQQNRDRARKQWEEKKRRAA